MGGNEREVMSHSFLANSNGILYDRRLIVVIDRYPLSRSCLTRVLKSEFQDFSILEIETVQQFDSILDRKIGLIVFDVGNHPISDEGLLQNLTYVYRSSAEGPIILVTSSDESISDAAVAEVMRFGVKGYVTATATIEIALAAFRLVIAGGIYFPRSVIIDCQDWAPASSETLVALQPVASVHEAASEVPAIASKAKVAFTERERQVLASLLRGRSNKVIAGELNLSQNTIKSHISRIMHKLHARNRTEAVILSQYSVSTPNGGEMGHISEPECSI